jgi:6-hydroxycyclohex-1-ene-1-carbonyl-CoA dehydrogenase
MDSELAESAPVTGTKEFTAYEMVEPGRPVRSATRPIRRLEAGEVLVRVAGCGVCHTDIGFLYEGVRTRHSLPLVLGHEISGHVVDGGPGRERLIGQAVVVPAVLPCRSCDLCVRSRPTICRAQRMPGNDCDGGFATHVILPGRDLCRVPGASEDPDAAIGSVPGLTLKHLAVVADAVSTAYQSVERSGIAAGDFAIVVGLGGVGGYAAQIAADRGAVVVGLDVDPARLEAGSTAGVGFALDPRALPSKELKARISEYARLAGAPQSRWTIFECSGTAAGQSTAYGLLVPGGTILIVGFTLASVEIRLSNLMALDARALGNWGCAPELYPEILEKVVSGRIDVVSGTELKPLSRIQEALDEVREHRAQRRIVLTPDAGEEVS